MEQPRRHRTTAEEYYLLVIEISDSTLRFDLDTKAPLYAEHGIRELWTVDLKSRRVHFFRDLQGKNYRHLSTSTASGNTSIEALPGVSIDLSFLRKF